MTETADELIFSFCTATYPALRRPEFTSERELDMDKREVSSDAIRDASTKSQLSVGEQNWTFPVHDGTIGPSVVDITKLYATSGLIHLDRRLRIQDHLYRWRCGYPALSRLPDRATG